MRCHPGPGNPRMPHAKYLSEPGRELVSYHRGVQDGGIASAAAPDAFQATVTGSGKHERDVPTIHSE